jgi:chromatin remodeling complex protein RSC6
MAKAAKKAATAATKSPKKAAADKSESKPPKKAAAKKANQGGSKSGGTANAGLMKPITVDADLAKVVGQEPLPRTQVIKKMWDYIKANDLQDKDNRRMINADETLKVVFDGKDQVSMFELAKVINNHLK